MEIAGVLLVVAVKLSAAPFVEPIKAARAASVARMPSSAGAGLIIARDVKMPIMQIPLLGDMGRI